MSYLWCFILVQRSFYFKYYLPFQSSRNCFPWVHRSIEIGSRSFGSWYICFLHSLFYWILNFKNIQVYTVCLFYWWGTWYCVTLLRSQSQKLMTLPTYSFYFTCAVPESRWLWWVLSTLALLPGLVPSNAFSAFTVCQGSARIFRIAVKMEGKIKYHPPQKSKCDY